MTLKSAAEITKRIDDSAELLTKVRLRAEQDRETLSLPEAEPGPVDVGLERSVIRPGSRG